MQFHKIITLKDGRTCTLRNGTAEDGQALLDFFNLTHAQTDYLLTYPEEFAECWRKIDNDWKLVPNVYEENSGTSIRTTVISL